MTMISDQDFTAAMERAVEKRGSDWRYPSQGDFQYHPQGGPVYSTPGGEVACLIGAVMKELGLPVPTWTNTASAEGVLGSQVSPAVLVAARAAQIHQDKRMPWGEAMAVYHAAYRAVTSGFAYAWDTFSVYYKAVQIVSGGHVPTAEKETITFTTFSGMKINFGPVPVAKVTWTGASTQKEHTLVA